MTLRNFFYLKRVLVTSPCDCLVGPLRFLTRCNQAHTFLDSSPPVILSHQEKPITKPRGFISTMDTDARENILTEKRSVSRSPQRFSFTRRNRDALCQRSLPNDSGTWTIDSVALTRASSSDQPQRRAPGRSRSSFQPLSQSLHYTTKPPGKNPELLPQPKRRPPARTQSFDLDHQFHTPDMSISEELPLPRSIMGSRAHSISLDDGSSQENRSTCASSSLSQSQSSSLSVADTPSLSHPRIPIKTKQLQFIHYMLLAIGCTAVFMLMVQVNIHSDQLSVCDPCDDSCWRRTSAPGREWRKAPTNSLCHRYNAAGGNTLPTHINSSLSSLTVPLGDDREPGKESHFVAGRSQPFLNHENEDPQTVPPPSYFMVFSTSCSSQMNWESYVFMFHAFKVKQPGNITRIVSGCTSDGRKALESFHQQHIVPHFGDHFGIHFTPDYSHIALAEGQSYKYMNKPYGLRHWLRYGLLELPEVVEDSTDSLHFLPEDEESRVLPKKLEESIVFLLDPDFILLKPLLHDFRDDPFTLWTEESPGPPLDRRIVRSGNPIALRDGYLSGDEVWRHLNFANITAKPKGGYKEPPPVGEAPLYWDVSGESCLNPFFDDGSSTQATCILSFHLLNLLLSEQAGPPYLATVGDMWRVAHRWCVYAPRIVEIHPKLFAEMYGLIVAAIQLDLPFTLGRSFTVSYTGGTDREGWPLVDQLYDDEICTATASRSQLAPRLPVAIHYCQRYSVGRHFFSKYRLRKDILQCDKPILLLPPDDLGHKSLNYSIVPPTALDPPRLVDVNDGPHDDEKVVIFQSEAQEKREKFMVCSLMRAINEAVTFYKVHGCDGSNPLLVSNLNETYTVFVNPGKQ
jgi:peptidyl serine alpha-galactosyltransferase